MLALILFLLALLSPCPTEDSHGCTFYQDTSPSFTAIPHPADPSDNDLAIIVTITEGH